MSLIQTTQPKSTNSITNLEQKPMDTTFNPHVPEAQSPTLHLTNPTTNELKNLDHLTFPTWGDALTLPQYLEESTFLNTLPLAKNNGMQTWILVDRSQAPDKRAVLSSCETFRKRAFVTNTQGEQCSEVIVYGVASVFCNPRYRGRGFAARMMCELALLMPGWQVGSRRCVGSVLFSDIGAGYYKKLGWDPFPVNTHLEFDAKDGLKEASLARDLLAVDLGPLCEVDEGMIWKAMTSAASSSEIRMRFVPDLYHMQWHHGKEEFAAGKLFGKIPEIKGAIAGQQPGDRIWAIWTHRFYTDPGSAARDNTLFFLRVVVEQGKNDDIYREMQVNQMEAVLQAAQLEAARWQLNTVQMWDPAPLVRELVERTKIPYRHVDREQEGIASLLWFGEGSGKDHSLKWIGNEHYGWC